MMRFWNRVLMMDESRLTRKIFEYDYVKCKDNWCAQMKKLFYKLDERDIFNNKSMCDIENLSIINMNQSTTEWADKLDGKPKLRTYILFKDAYSTEDYVKYCFPRYQRSLLAQLRCGVLPLEVEIARFRNKKLEHRLC